MSKTGSLSNLYIYAVSTAFALGLCATLPTHAQQPTDNPNPATADDRATKNQDATATSPDKPEWRQLPTDDKRVWAASVFGGDGDITLASEGIKMSAGDPITGVRCLAEMPKENFEIELEGRRTDGFDFFCALTFPVGEEGRCSFVVGGWAGAVVGLSSVDGLDAARNSTKKLMHFENGQWYKIRVRVDATDIHCWIDDKSIVQQPRAGHEFDIRAEMYESLPIGIAAFMCGSEIRNIRWRNIEEEK